MGKRRFLSSGILLSLKLTMAVLCMLFLVTSLPGTSLSADETTGKQEVKPEAKPEVQPETKQQENPYAKADITIKILPSANNTFGYDILLITGLLCISRTYRDCRGMKVSPQRKGHRP